MAKSMAQLTSAITSPRRMRKIQSSPTLEMRNRWHCKAQTVGTRVGSGPGTTGMGTPGWQGQAGRDPSAHGWQQQPGTVQCRSCNDRWAGTASSGCAQPHTAPQGMHLPPAWSSGMAPGRGTGGPWSLQCAQLFWAIVSPLPSGQVALSSVPVSRDSQRNPTLHHRDRVGSHA